LYNKQQQKRDFTPVNNQIRSSKVICIDQNNNNLGEIDLSEALKLSYAVELDLVQISQSKDSSPVCKILDFGKHKYQEQKNKKQQAKKQRENTVRTREIQFRPSTDINDLKTKANKAREFLKDGDNVKISITFKGREVSYQELARETLKQFLELVPELQLMESPTMSGKILSALGTKKKEE